MTNNIPNVWTQMNYVPPRGSCNHKASFLAPNCPCLRFMLHPLKSSSSYECDGCGHHASFHNMENKAEDEIRKRWEAEAKEKAEVEQQRQKKRPRLIGNGNSEDDRLVASLTETARSRPKTWARAAATRANNRIIDLSNATERD